MCNLYIQVIPKNGNNHYNVFKETVLTHRNANSDDAALNIVNELKDKRVKIIPDSTGKARSTKSRSSESDIEIFKSYGLDVMQTRNPIIRDRQNSVNIAFRKNMITIDPSCKNLIKELESLSSRDNEGLISHLGPCLGYVIWKFDPVKRTHGKSSSIQL